jgi:hypothetical protein
VHQSEISCETKKAPKETKTQSIHWKTLTSTRIKKNKGEQVASKGSE